jgi:hypothetical protein
MGENVEDGLITRKSWRELTQMLFVRHNGRQIRVEMKKGTLDPLRFDLQFNYVCRGGAFLALHNLKTHFLPL